MGACPYQLPTNEILWEPLICPQVAGELFLLNWGKCLFTIFSWTQPVSYGNPSGISVGAAGLPKAHSESNWER